MKPLIFSILFLLSVSALAQPSIKQEHHALRAGDYITKQQVEYRDAGSNGRNLTWDFRFLQPINENYILQYSQTRDTSIICGLEHNTRYYFRQTVDSLLALGYENSTTIINYSKPELKLKYPFAYGDTLYSEFEGVGEYSRRLPLSIKGWTRVHADATGTLMLPDGTVNNAIRVHTVKHYIETKRAAVETTLDIYQWYLRGARYPVFESIKTIFHQQGSYQYTNEYDNTAAGDSVVFTTSYYYPPELQLSEDDDNSQSADEEAQGAAAVFTEASLMPNPVVSTLSIDYKLTRSAQIWFSLHSGQGVIMRSTQPVQQNAGHNHVEINMSGLMTGIYPLYVHVDGMVMQLNVIKN
jgi:hypothetical protein